MVGRGTCRRLSGDQSKSLKLAFSAAAGVVKGGSASAAGMLAPPYLILGKEPRVKFEFLLEPALGGGSGTDRAPDELTADAGTDISSRSFSRMRVSPLRVGRGPRIGRVINFSGQRMGIAHSMASRCAWPLPRILPEASTVWCGAEITLADKGKDSPGRVRLSNSSLSQPLPTKCPGSRNSTKRPERYAPRGNTGRPNIAKEPILQSTGSPTCTVSEENLGSFSVHWKRVPAGTMDSVVCAPAAAARHNTAAKKRENLRIIASAFRSAIRTKSRESRRYAGRRI